MTIKHNNNKHNNNNNSNKGPVQHHAAAGPAYFSYEHHKHSDYVLHYIEDYTYTIIYTM